jgi:transposase
MPAERTAMRQVREVLRLKFVGSVRTREIARRLGVAPSTVRETLKRFEAAGLIWPLPEEMTDEALEAKLFTNAASKQSRRRHTEPDWAAVHRELKRKHVTLMILWEEYIEREPQGYRYSRYVELARRGPKSPCDASEHGADQTFPRPRLLGRLGSPAAFRASFKIDLEKFAKRDCGHEADSNCGRSRCRRGHGHLDAVAQDRAVKHPAFADPRHPDSGHHRPMHVGTRDAGAPQVGCLNIGGAKF